MRIEDFARFQRTPEGLEDIKVLWAGLKSKAVKDGPTQLEWLVWRIFLAIGDCRNDPREMTNMLLDEDLGPKRHAPGDKPDLVLTYAKRRLVGEATERPIPGKVEHFSHLSHANEKYGGKFIGVLIVKGDIAKVPSEVWSTYKRYFDGGKGLFMITNIDLLMGLLRKGRDKASERWMSFLDESERIWTTEQDWKKVREGIIELHVRTLA